MFILQYLCFKITRMFIFLLCFVILLLILLRSACLCFFSVYVSNSMILLTLREGSDSVVNIVLHKKHFQLGFKVPDLSERSDEMSVRILAVGRPVVHSNDDSILRQVGRLGRHDPDFWQASVEGADEQTLAATDFADGLCLGLIR